MSDRKFTDDEVIKALECCVEGTSEACRKCVFGLTPPYPVCKTVVEKYALALINRQKAEIERLELLTQSLNLVITELQKDCENTKAEAIKEFAERLKATPVRFASITGFGNPPIMGKKVLYIDDNDIDNLVKEMTEGGGEG